LTLKYIAFNNNTNNVNKTSPVVRQSFAIKLRGVSKKVRQPHNQSAVYKYTVVITFVYIGCILLQALYLTSRPYCTYLVPSCAVWGQGWSNTM